MMYQVKKNTAIASVSELRSSYKKILEETETNDVILQTHNEPTAVIINYQKYIELEGLLDLAENYILESLAKSRDSDDPKEFIPLEEW